MNDKPLGEHSIGIEREPLVLAIPGPRIQLEENARIRDLLIGHVEQGHTRLVLDFREIEFVDSSFLGILIVVLKRVTAVGGDVRLCGLQKPIRQIFQLMRLDRLFVITESVEGARKTFR